MGKAYNQRFSLPFPPERQLTWWQQDAARTGSLNRFKNQFDKIHGKDDSKIVLHDKIHGKDASKIVLHTKAQAVAQGDAPGGAGGWLEIRVGVALPAAPCARRCCTRLRPDPARLLSPKITPGLYINKRLEEA